VETSIGEIMKYTYGKGLTVENTSTLKEMKREIWKYLLECLFYVYKTEVVTGENGVAYDVEIVVNLRKK
jgi:hypothetical protein